MFLTWTMLPSPFKKLYMINKYLILGQSDEKLKFVIARVFIRDRYPYHLETKYSLSQEEDVEPRKLSSLSLVYVELESRRSVS